MIYAMSDLHLYNTTKKNMDIFGKIWENHMDKIKQNWPLTESDTIIIPGDISWGLKLSEAEGDIAYIDSLPGKKILLKGNHDLWWNSAKKLDDLLKKYKSISYIFNNSIEVENVTICGTRGWDINSFTDEDKQILLREAMRLERSINYNIQNTEKIVFMHYPPILKDSINNIFLDIFKKYNIKKVYFGHLHGEAINNAILGEYNGISFKNIAADQLNFSPMVVKGEKI